LNPLQDHDRGNLLEWPLARKLTPEFPTCGAAKGQVRLYCAVFLVVHVERRLKIQAPWDRWNGNHLDARERSTQNMAVFHRTGIQISEKFTGMSLLQSDSISEFRIAYLFIPFETHGAFYPPFGL
jgi:hypothetical protein